MTINNRENLDFLFIYQIFRQDFPGTSSPRSLAQTWPDDWKGAEMDQQKSLIWGLHIYIYTHIHTYKYIHTYITLHCVALDYITLSLHYTTLTLHYITLYCITYIHICFLIYGCVFYWWWTGLSNNNGQWCIPTGCFTDCMDEHHLTEPWLP